MTLPSDLPEFLQPHPYQVMGLCEGWPHPVCYGEFQDYGSARERASDLREATREWASVLLFWVIYVGEKIAPRALPPVAA